MAGLEHKAIHSVLRLLLIDGEDWTRYGGGVNSVALRNAQGKFTPLKEKELENCLLHKSKGELPEDRVIYIKPPSREKSAVAAIWCRWDFNEELSRCGFYFGIWSEQEAFPNPGDGRKYTAFIGFRYETPEDGCNHDYYHAQPCRSMVYRDRSQVVHSLPISVRYPTFPLAAKSSLDLLLCLVTSIYGMNGLKKLKYKVSDSSSMRQNELLLRSLEKVVNRLRCGGCGT